MIKRILPIMFYRFSIDPLALKDCTLKIFKTSNKKFGYQAFNEYSADKFNIAYIFDI